MNFLPSVIARCFRVGRAYNRKLSIISQHFVCFGCGWGGRHSSAKVVVMLVMVLE